MHKFIYSVKKELTLLFRDKMGLAVLFFMPAVLVTVVSIVQDSAWKGMSETTFTLLWVDQDGSNLSRDIKHRLEGSPHIKVFEKRGGESPTPEIAMKAVAEGQFHAGLVVQKDAGKKAREKSRNEIESQLEDADSKQSEAPLMEIFFDPILSGALKSALRSTIEAHLKLANLRLVVDVLSEALPAPLSTSLSNIMDVAILELHEKNIVSDKNKVSIPTSTQQNVPAWTLFAMFFVVIPISSNIIKENTEGTLIRYRSMPVSYALFLGGKIAVFVAVCLLQFLMMLAIGIFLLPRLGLPVFDVNPSHWPALVVALSAALAACGFGVLFGTAFTTQEQSSTFGAVAVVLGAAVGGIMVPVFVMPELMQKISLFSPLGWGQKAFMNVFLRGHDLTQLGSEIGFLLMFFVSTLGLAVFIYSRRIRP